MYVQFYNETKSCAYWLVNETLLYETEMRSRHLIFSPRRDQDRGLLTFLETETFGNYVSRPSRDRDRDYIPGLHHAIPYRWTQTVRDTVYTAVI